MRKITGKHLLCFLLLIFPLSWAEDTKKDVRKTENNTEAKKVQVHLLFLLRGGLAKVKRSDDRVIFHSDEGPLHGRMPKLTIWSQGKTRPIFARRKISTPQESHIPRHKSELMTPVRRCSRLTENCSSHAPCCDPCASCRCRLFNTICHCWRMNPMCLKRT